MLFHGDVRSTLWALQVWIKTDVPAFGAFHRVTAPSQRSRETRSPDAKSSPLKNSLRSPFGLILSCPCRAPRVLSEDGRKDWLFGNKQQKNRTFLKKNLGHLSVVLNGIWDLKSFASKTERLLFGSDTYGPSRAIGLIIKISKTCRAPGPSSKSSPSPFLSTQ